MTILWNNYYICNMDDRYIIDVNVRKIQSLIKLEALIDGCTDSSDRFTFIRYQQLLESLTANSMGFIKINKREDLDLHFEVTEIAREKYGEDVF